MPPIYHARLPRPERSEPPPSAHLCSSQTSPTRHLILPSETIRLGTRLCRHPALDRVRAIRPSSRSIVKSSARSSNTRTVGRLQYRLSQRNEADLSSRRGTRDDHSTSRPPNPPTRTTRLSSNARPATRTTRRALCWHSFDRQTAWTIDDLRTIFARPLFVTIKMWKGRLRYMEEQERCGGGGEGKVFGNSRRDAGCEYRQKAEWNEGHGSQRDEVLCGYSKPDLFLFLRNES
jgi:hypothetical protein